MSSHSISPDDTSRSKPATSMKDLKARAHVDINDAKKYSAKTWVHTTSKLFEKAQESYNTEDFETAYVNYLKACTITVAIIPNLPDYNFKDQSYIDLRQKTEKYMSLLEKIAETLNKVFQARSSVNSAPTKVPDAVPASLMTQTTTTSEQPISSNSSNRSAIDSVIAELPPVPQHQPTYIHNRTPANNKKPPPAPPTSTKPPQWKPPSASPKPSMETNLDMTSVAVALDTIPLAHSTAPVSSPPPPTNILIPKTSTKFEISMMMTPKQLATHLTKKVDPPSILLIDVRPRDDFIKEHINGRWVLNIEPLTLKRDVTSARLEESLCMATEREQILFKKRHEFDLIVYYDQGSTNPADYPLPYLADAIFTHAFTNPLRHCPALLIGGFDAWCKETGTSKGSVARMENGESILILENSTVPVLKNNSNGAIVEPKLYTSGAGDINGVKNEKINHNLSRDVALLERKSPQDVISRSQGRLINRTLYDYFNNPDDVKQSMIQPNYLIDKQLIMTPGIPSTSHAFQSVQPPLVPSRPAAVSSQENKKSSQVSRRNTFIDNPYLGFTHSKSQMFEPPPAAPLPTLESPAPQKPRPDPKYREPSKPPSPIVQPDTSTILNGRRHLPTSSGSFSDIGIVSIGTTGLKNLGNTCFMNSVIQCLSGTIPLARYFLSGSYRKDLNEENLLGSRGELAKAFAKLLRAMWSEQSTYISPVSFREALISFAPQFGGSEQQDSQEFLAFLLDGLHEDLNLVKQKPPPSPKSPEAEEDFEQMATKRPWEASKLAWERYLMRDSSFIVNLFQGQYKNKMICSFCKKTSTTYDSFMYLSLPIPSGQKVTLEQCLDNFVKEETLTGQDAWHCPRCKTPRRATKQLTLSRLPIVLLIHLKRFSFKGPFRDKLETLVTYPIRGLDLTRYLPGYAIQQAITGGPVVIPEKGTSVVNTNKGVFGYDLYAVSNHFGGLNGGHYTACVRNGYRNQWQNFDDSRVSVCDESNIMARSAYTLFYVRNTVQ